MPFSSSPQAALRASWETNAPLWAEAVREGRIPSRKAATDAAIVEAILDGLPMGGRVLDMGCGEGWLSRALHQLGVHVHGIDGSAALIQTAQDHGHGTFDLIDYELAADSPERLGGPYDVAVFNFALLDDDAVSILRAARSCLDIGGRVLIQTTHPISLEAPYSDGWRRESFADVGDGFAPMPWYFRTLSSWIRAIRSAGLTLTDLREPVDADTGAPLSLLLTTE
ncbi:MAG: class I SAM-dependent methyltransferase [Rubricoccaceae bacterium]